MKYWEKALVSLDTPIRDLIKIIDAHSLQIGVVVDAKKRLLGTVTDGDVRRGILRGVGLQRPVELIMHKRCISAGIDEDRKNILSIMKRKQVHQVPLLDKKGRELFEGDIVRVRLKDKEFTGVVGPVPDMFGSRKLHPLEGLLKENGITGNPDSLDIEVLGNEYENPELLKLCNP